VSAEDRFGAATQDAEAPRLNRRELVRRAAVLGAAPALIAPLAATPAAASTTSSAGAATASAGVIPGPPWKGGTKGGEVTVSYADQLVTLDPPVSYDQGGYYGLQNFYRGLLLYSGADPLTPKLDMAESMDVSSNGRRYQFKLKPGIQFHNGREVTAKDFKYTLERTTSKAIASWAGPFLANVKGYKRWAAGTAHELSGVKVINPHTLEITLDQADVMLLGALSIAPYFVLPREEVKRLGKKFASSAVGTGPYKLVSFDEGSSTYTAERNPDFYDSQLPYLDKLTWQWGVTRELEYLRVQRNQSDAAAAGLAPATIPRAAANPKFAKTFKRNDNFFPVWVEFNMTKPPFDDVRVRRAFNHAVDKKRLTPLAVNPTGHFFPTGVPGYDPALKTYEYDPEKATSMLRAAGYDFNTVIELPIFNQGNEGQQFIAQDLKQIGIKAKLVNVPNGFSDLGLKLRDRFHLWSMSWGMGTPDTNELIVSLIGSDAPSNYGGYANTEVDRLSKLALAESNRAKRAELYARVEKILMTEAPFIFLGTHIWATFRSPRLHNYNWSGVYFEFWDRIWVAN
jgi:oligopeptide transport system substrate-binding protein